MIIACIKCSTKFRFDESLIENEGVWVRCSRCQEIFFQLNPARAELRKAADVAAGLNAPLPEADENSPELDKTLTDAGEKEIDAFLERVEETKKTLEEHQESESVLNIGKNISKTPDPEDGSIDVVMKPTAVEKPEQEMLSRKPEKRGFWSPLRIIALILFINLLFGGVYFSFFSGRNESGIQNITSAVPLIGDLFGAGEKSGTFNLSQIKLLDLRQRIVDNAAAGQVRVIEGLAVNSTGYPITRLQIKGELYDANKAVMSEGLSYGGNLLNDEELMSMTKEDLQKEMNLPMGSDAQNIRIEPKGQIPFMIIFPNEPPGVVRATVFPVGGEKLPK